VEGFDFWQHFDEVCYCIIKGKCLMQQVLTDAMSGISLLFGLPYVDKNRIGTLGHSMGGNTVLFLAALDERISFACASGSACTYEHRMKNGVGIEMASVIPGFHGSYDMDDLVSLTAPRKLLLVSADAAFAGLVDKMPDFDLPQFVLTLVVGVGVACLFYTRGAALLHNPKAEAPSTFRQGVNALTVNTVLIAVCMVYVVYLLSQLAYFVGGFAGILPEGFTMAEYARRGFFEMGWLCAINLGIIALAVGLVEQAGRAPLLSRILCLFLGIVTLFFVVTASAKMGMYIGSYGLTRLRVLTEVIMVFLGLATATVCIWLFVPKMPYMKVVLLLALVIGAAVIWADVDTVVASYNVRAYQSGKLDAVDVEYLTTLSAGAVPYIAQLAENGDETAQAFMEEYGSTYYWDSNFHDLRSWNWADWRAAESED